jgi:two-component system cell cycle response regulator
LRNAWRQLTPEAIGFWEATAHFGSEKRAGRDGARERDARVMAAMRMKVVIVDDQPAALRMLERQIAGIPDLELATFEDPERALAWCRENEPDLVLVDYMMPKLDGIALIRCLRDLPSLGNTPIIMVTATEDPPLLLRALDQGANDFLSKPPNFHELKARVSSMLRLRAAALEIKAANAALVEANRELTRLATTDPLTEIYNRRYFLQHAGDEFARIRRYGGVFSVFMLDIDHFKQVNDTQGHDGGDQVLKHVCRLVGEMLRTIDCFGRLGGEEFAVLLPETDAPGVQLVADRIRVALAATPAALDAPDGARALTVTASFGTATFSTADKDFAALLGRADAALYLAKRAGRNRVMAAAEPVAPS